MKLKKLFMVVGMCIVSVAAYAGSTPKQTVYNFFNGWQRGNINAALREVNGASNLSEEEKQQLGAMWLLLFGSNSMRPQVTDVEETGYNQAVVYVRLTNPVTGERTTENFNLRKIGGEWKILLD